MDGNGNNIAGSPFTGSSLAGVTKNVPGATVRVRLTTDGSVTGYGFRVVNITAGTTGSVAPGASDNHNALALFAEENSSAADDANGEINFSREQQATTESASETTASDRQDNRISYQSDGFAGAVYYPVSEYNSSARASPDYTRNSAARFSNINNKMSQQRRNSNASGRQPVVAYYQT